MVEIKSILCPVDFSDGSHDILKHAAAIADWYDARLVALHVIHPVLLPEATALFDNPAAEAVVDLSERVDRQLNDLLTPARGAGLRVEARIEEGVPTSRILDSAASVSADL